MQITTETFSSIIILNSHYISGFISIVFFILSLLCMIYVCMSAYTHVGGSQKTTFESQFSLPK